MNGESKRRISFSADSVLSAVVQDGDISELMRILCDNEVKVNQVNHVGLTALHQSVLCNNLDAVKLLLCHGADVNAQDVHGFSPLHTAAACGFVQITSLLLVYGADVFSLTAQKEMAIDVAKEISVVRLLSEEMRQKIHQELFLASVIRRKSFEFLVFLGQCTLQLMHDGYQMIFRLWKQRHKAAENKNEKTD